MNLSSIELDFSDLKIASASFFDEGIAKLIDHGWDANNLKTKLTFTNLFPKDKELLHKILKLKKIEL